MTTVALAGRLIDKPGADAPRFPLANVALVEQRLLDYFRATAVENLVCSAACGADLTALRAAAAAEVAQRFIVLPFPADVFRKTSVSSRPGDWNAAYDAAIADARAHSTLVELDLVPGDGAYEAATARIIEEAARLGPPFRACIVWEGVKRETADHSNSLGRLAKSRGWPIDTISTL